MCITIKGADEDAFRNLKAEVARLGIKVGEAATEAFRMWVASKRQGSVQAAKDMDRLRL